MLANKDILIAKYLSGNASPEETKKLNDWLKQDPSHQSEFERIEKLWNTSLNLKKDKDADVEAAWNEFRSLTEAQPEIRIRKPQSNWMSIAAAVALFLVVGVFVKLFMASNIAPVSTVAVITPELSPAPEVVDTLELIPVIEDSAVTAESATKSVAKPARKLGFPKGSSIPMITVNAGDSAKIFMLPDNSIVYLNANSKLEYPYNFNKTNRRVSLIGEAYFDVKKDSGQFVVACENTIIRGKATSFNVKSYSADKEVEVIVASGFVEFSGIGYKDFKKLVIKSGESGYYKKAKSEIVKSKHQRKNYKWWQKKSLRAKIRDFFNKLLGKKH